MKQRLRDVAVRIVGIVETEFKVGINTEAHEESINQVLKILKKENRRGSKHKGIIEILQEDRIKKSIEGIFILSLLVIVCNLVGLLLILKIHFGLHDYLYGPTTLGLTFAKALSQVTVICMALGIVFSLALYLACFGLVKLVEKSEKKI